MPGVSQLTRRPSTLSKQARPEPHQASRLYWLMRKRGVGLSVTVTGLKVGSVGLKGAQVDAGGSWANGRK